MSRIDDLVKELCPDGVMGVPLGDLCTFNRGRWIKASELHEGTIPVVTSSQNVSAWHDESNRRGETIVVASSGAYAGFVSFWNEPIYVSNAFSVDPNESSGIVPKFLFHVLRRRQREINAMASVAGVPNVYGKDLARMVVQIPPLAVQREIVRILDQFTQLEAELEAELEVRCRQYEYYRCREMRFSGSVARIPLGELVQVKAGTAVSKRSIQENPGPYPVINSGREPLGYIGEYNTEDNPIGITSRGAGAGSITWCEGRYYRGSLNYGVIIKGTNELDVRFLYHSLRNMQSELRALCSFQGIPALNKASLERLVLPLPDMAVQMKVVSILDKFDALVNDLNSGLPAEIAARRKQYEYYRDRLLTFPEKGASA